MQTAFIHLSVLIAKIHSFTSILRCSQCSHVVIYQRWKFCWCYRIENRDEVHPQPLQLFIVVDKNPTANVLYRTIEKLLTICKYHEKVIQYTFAQSAL